MKCINEDMERGRCLNEDSEIRPQKVNQLHRRRYNFKMKLTIKMNLDFNFDLKNGSRMSKLATSAIFAEFQGV